MNTENGEEKEEQGEEGKRRGGGQKEDVLHSFSLSLLLTMPFPFFLKANHSLSP